jgi:hypothetical protein
MTKQEAEWWQARWRAVEEAEREELRATPLEVKLQQLAGLMAAARDLGWTEALAEEAVEVRERWRKIRKAFRG